jgi:hypothetical protein
MFYGCTSLNKIIVNFTDWNATGNWVYNVSSTGTFICPTELPIQYGNNYIPEGWTVINDSNETPLTLTAEEANSTIKLTIEGLPVIDGLQYRLNTSGEWIKYAIGTEITLANIGDIVQFQNTNNKLSTSTNDNVKFGMTGKIAASGNIQSMLNYSDSCTNWCYVSMFKGCTSLTKAPKLPATTLAEGCYVSMFEGCTSLTKAPELPATTLATVCYGGMFSGCTSLTKVPELPATTLATVCYGGMFSGCTSLTKAPELPATKLAASCYQYMFDGCTSLNYVKVGFTNWYDTIDATDDWLPGVATTGTFVCPTELPITFGKSYIPEGWTVINDSDETPLTFTAEEANSTIKLDSIGSPTVDGLQYRTNNSSSWTKYTIDTVITLPNVGDYVQFQNTKNQLNSYRDYVKFEITGQITATGNIQSMLNYSTSCQPYCYQSMFSGCTSLTTAPELPATNLAAYCYDDMFYSCTNLVEAPELPATTLIDGCYQSMFSGCTSLTKVPELPAINLAERCYFAMFSDCTSLTTAPELPATALAKSCYENMFYGCTSLSEIKVLFTDWTDDNGPTYYWLSNVSSTGTFYKPSALSNEYGQNKIPFGWTIENTDTGERFEYSEVKEFPTTLEVSNAGIENVNGEYHLSNGADGMYFYRKWITHDFYAIAPKNTPDFLTGAEVLYHNNLDMENPTKYLYSTNGNILGNSPVTWKVLPDGIAPAPVINFETGTLPSDNEFK